MRNLWIAAVLSLASVTATADLAAFRYSATVSNVSDANDVLGGQISIGDTVDGNFWYDTDLPDLFPDRPELGRYVAPRPYVDNGIAATVGPIDLNTMGVTRAIPIPQAVNDDWIDDSITYGFTWWTNDLGFMGESDPYTQVAISLRDKSYTAFSSDSLPLTYDLDDFADWNDLKAVLINGGGTDADGTRYGVFSVAATLTEIESIPIPTPSAFILGGIGLGMVAWIRKRRMA